MLNNTITTSRKNTLKTFKIKVQKIKSNNKYILIKVKISIFYFININNLRINIKTEIK
jgi:hypothetical protein